MKVNQHLSNKYARWILLLTTCSSTFSYLGIVIGIDVFKAISVPCQVMSLILSIKVITKYKESVNWNLAVPIIAILFGYPLIRTIIDIISGFTLKKATDGLLVFNAYYQLVLPGLAMAIISFQVDILRIYKKFCYFIIPVGLILFVLAITSPSKTKIGLGHLALTTSLIPIALLIMQRRDKTALVIGWLSIGIGLFLSSKIWSRSYTLVEFYLVLSALQLLIRRRQFQMLLSIAAIVLFAYSLNLFDFFTQESDIQDSSIVDKYNFDSFLAALNQFIKDGDFAKLYYWEGNSRADILVDAFKDFTFSDYVFGKGTFGTYVSFVERNTIEIGWIQKAFNWGIPYTLYFVYAIIVARKKMIMLIDKTKYTFFSMLSPILLIKLLDGFVFGMPQYTIYSFLMYWGMMFYVCKIPTTSSRSRLVNNTSTDRRLVLNN